MTLPMIVTQEQWTAGRRGRLEKTDLTGHRDRPTGVGPASRE